LEELNRIKNLPKHKLEHLIAIIATYQPDDDTVVLISENWLRYKTLKKELNEMIKENKRHSEAQISSYLQ